MKRFTLLLFLPIIILSCRSATKKAKENPTNSLKQALMGKWGGTEGGPGLNIRADSIYYYDRDLSYPYYLHGDTFSVKFPDRDTATIFGTVAVNGDTLKIRDIIFPNEITFAYRHSK